MCETCAAFARWVAHRRDQFEAYTRTYDHPGQRAEAHRWAIRRSTLDEVIAELDALDARRAAIEQTMTADHV